MKIFFYGLFMDDALLAEKGIGPTERLVGSLAGFQLRIGERATLLRREDAQAYGVVMDIGAEDVASLYSEASVADYVPEPVTVDLVDGGTTDAVCYNLPAEKITGTNHDYAAALLALAIKLGFPAAYLEQIKTA